MEWTCGIDSRAIDLLKVAIFPSRCCQLLFLRGPVFPVASYPAKQLLKFLKILNLSIMSIFFATISHLWGYRIKPVDECESMIACTFLVTYEISPFELRSSTNPIVVRACLSSSVGWMTSQNFNPLN